MGGTGSFSRGRKPGPFRDWRNGEWGALIDGGTVHTCDNTKQDQDWYAVTLAKPATVGRVVFLPGNNRPDGGWFDTSAGEPQVQVQTEKDGPWITVGELTDYPATTATDSKNIKLGTRFTCVLAKPVTLLAVRILGKPACGNNPKQSFSSCAGLAVYER